MTVSLLGSSTQSNRRGITSRYCGGWVGPPPAVGDVSNRADDRFVAPGEHLWFVVLLGNGTCEVERPTGAAVATGIQNSLGAGAEDRFQLAQRLLALAKRTGLGR
jgi:hypothetical protein